MVNPAKAGLTRLDLDQNWAFFKGLDVIPINRR